MDDKQLHGLLNAYSFKVEIGKDAIGFKAVKGIKLTTALEPLQVGGINDGPVMLPVPVKEGGRLTLERGKYKADGLKQFRPGTLIKEMRIHALAKAGDKKGAAIYTVEFPVVESVELGAFDALSSEVLIESFTVAYRRIKEA
jgi:phage tail-like protein